MILNYKGYIGEVEFDEASLSFFGRVKNTRDVITFEGDTAQELQQAFRDSIEDYLVWCKERGEQPDKPFSGEFRLRLKPDTHKQAFFQAKAEGKSLNSWVAEKIEQALNFRTAS